MKEQIWHVRAMEAAKKIGAREISFDRWVYEAQEVGKWFMLTHGDLIALAVYLYNTPSQGYSLWCSAGFGTDVAHDGGLSAKCPVCQQDSVVLTGQEDFQLGCLACFTTFTVTEMTAKYRQVKRQAEDDGNNTNGAED